MKKKLKLPKVAMGDAWKVTRAEYIERNMPARAMGGGVCETILARFHAIAVQIALAAGENPARRVVAESHEILGSESTYPRKIVKKYPFLKK